MSTGEDSPNSTLHTVRRYVARKPRGATALRLVVREDASVQVLARWSDEELRPTVASEVVESLDAHCQAREANVVASLEWLDDASQVVQQRALKRRFKRPDDDVSGLPLSGSTSDQAAQAQRHLEVMTRLYYQGIGGSLQQMLKVSEATLKLLERVSERGQMAEDERDRLRAELDAMKPEQADKPDETQAELLGMAKQMLPLLAAVPKKA